MNDTLFLEKCLPNKAISEPVAITFVAVDSLIMLKPIA